MEWLNNLDSPTLIVILTFVFNLFIWLVQKFFNRNKDRDESKNITSSTINNLTETVSNLDTLYQNSMKRQDELEKRLDEKDSIIDRLGRDVKNINNEYQSLFDKNVELTENYDTLYKSHQRLKKETDTKIRQLTQENEILRGTVDKLVEDKNTLTNRFETEKDITEKLREKLNILIDQMREAGLKPDLGDTNELKNITEKLSN